MDTPVSSPVCAAENSTNCASPQIAAWLVRARVLHERLRPSRLRFIYPVFCFRFDLDRLHELNKYTWFGLNKRNLVSLHFKDYGLHDGSDLAPWIRTQLSQQDIEAAGPVILQTFPRILGYAFNPVSFWLCHNKNHQLIAVLAEVNNTFGVRHAYLLTSQDKQPITHDTHLVCQKTFHVSPFLQVKGQYQFRVRETCATSFIAINYSDDEGLILRTSIGGHVEPLSSRNFFRALLRQPFMTFSVIVHFHWQALRLWLRKVPFYGARHVPDTPEQGLPRTDSTRSKDPS